MPHSSVDMAYGVSNSFRRGLLKTYSRRPRAEDDTHPRKVIRMDSEGFVKVETSNTSGRSNNTNLVAIKLDDVGLSISRAREAASSQEILDHHSVSSYAPSTPVRESHVFSDSAAQGSSPLSSPTNSPPAKTHKPIFGLFKKRKRSSSNAAEGELLEASRPATPLTEITGNDRYSSQSQSNGGVQAPGRVSVGGGSLNKKPRLTQMTLDLGQDTRRTCKGCGMAYTPSNAEDAALHKSFHLTNVNGVDVGRSFKQEARSVGEGSGEGEVVVVVDRKSAPALRKRVEKVLEVVRQDLGAVEIEPDKLWSNMPCPVSAKKFGKALARAKEKGEEEEPKEDCFKAFLFLDKDRCVGLCLAERIGQALTVVDTSESPETAANGTRIDDSENNRHSAGIKSSSVTAERTTDTVLLGISRVWTSRSHRKKGIATALLDCVRGSFFYGIEIPKEMVAFSQPTESGGQLARKWFGKSTGWHVYEC